MVISNSPTLSFSGPNLYVQKLLKDVTPASLCEQLFIPDVMKRRAAAETQSESRTVEGYKPAHSLRLQSSVLIPSAGSVGAPSGLHSL